MAERTVTVRGVSERDVTANLATWSVDFSHKGDELAPVQQSVDQQARQVRDFFRAAGFKPGDISDSNISVSRERDSDDANAPDRVTVRRTIQLRTTDVTRARDAFARQAELLRNGVEMSSSTVRNSRATAARRSAASRTPARAISRSGRATARNATGVAVQARPRRSKRSGW